MVKQELKSIILSGLVDKGVFLKAGTEQQAPAEDPEAGAAGVALGTRCPEVPEVKPPPSLPRIQPFSIDSSPLSNVGARLKVRLAHLDLKQKIKCEERN